MASYYDIDAILTDAQKAPCTFEITVPGLGYLDGNVGADMKQGTRTELPLWLGEMLAISQSLSTSALATLDLPHALSARVMNALRADSRTVDLRAQAPYFYALGTRMLELFDEEEITEVLTDSFKARAAVIADQAHNPRGALGENADFVRGLDQAERQLFRAAHDSAAAVRKWISETKKK